MFHVNEKSYNNYIGAVISIRGKLDELTVRKDLSNLLANYMIPKKIILRSKLPLNSNGKIDRKKIINSN